MPTIICGINPSVALIGPLTLEGGVTEFYLMQNVGNWILASNNIAVMANRIIKSWRYKDSNLKSIKGIVHYTKLSINNLETIPSRNIYY